MPEQWMAMLSDAVLYVLAAEGLLLCIFQIRTNHILKQLVSGTRVLKKDAMEKIKEEVQRGSSDIPVVRFEKKKQEKETEAKKQMKKDGYDAEEMAILQEMMTEFFG